MIAGKRAGIIVITEFIILIVAAAATVFESTRKSANISQPSAASSPSGKIWMISSPAYNLFSPSTPGQALS